jgi:hypothetical protein
MTTNYRTFQISDNLFWGYKQKININLYTNTDDIINEMRTRLKEFLHQYNLEVLKEKVDTIDYNLPEFETILISKPTDIIYMCICDHS